MENNKNNQKVNNTDTKTGIKYVTPDGLVFTNRAEYLDYMEGFRS